MEKRAESIMPPEAAPITANVTVSPGLIVEKSVICVQVEPETVYAFKLTHSATGIGVAVGGIGVEVGPGVGIGVFDGVGVGVGVRDGVGVGVGVRDGVGVGVKVGVGVGV